MQTNCVECHRTGGVAPFALDTYEEVVAHKGMIRKAVDKGTMPPWFAAPPKKGEHSPFANDRTLTDADKTDLLAWLAGDLKKGDPADAPLPRKYESGWLIGKPDAVFQIPKPIAVKAEGTMPYQNVTVDDRLRRGPVGAGARGAADRPRGRPPRARVRGRRRVARRRRRGAGLLRRVRARQQHAHLPRGLREEAAEGRRRCVFQIHYTPNGKATTDQTKIGLVFAKEKPRHEVHVAGIANPAFTIPAGADNHKVDRDRTVHPVRRARPAPSSRTPTCAARRRSTS